MINNLPEEVINLIFENIKIKDLYRLRFTCCYWSKLIKRINDLRLDIEELHIADDKKINVININAIPNYDNTQEDYYSIFINVALYYTKTSYILSNLTEDEEVVKFINKDFKFNSFMNERNRKQTSYLRFFNEIKMSCDNHDERALRILVNATNSDAILENDKDKFLQFFINNYRLYYFYTEYPDYIESILDHEYKELYHSFDYLMSYGIIMVYPDKKTFSLHYQARGGHL